MKKGPDYYPAELVRARDTLRLLHLLAYPRTSGSLTTIGGARQLESSIPDPGGARWRRLLKRTLSDIDRVVERAARVVDGDPSPRPRGRRCSSCGSGQRPQAKLCDQCGADLRAREAS